MAAGATGPVRLIEMGINVGIYYISEYDKELGTHKPQEQTLPTMQQMT